MDVGGEEEEDGEEGCGRGVSGAEALPEGVNVTIWRHDGGGEGDTGSARCEWGRRLGGRMSMAVRSSGEG